MTPGTFIIVAVATVVSGLLGWLIRAIWAGNERKHIEHFKHAADTKLHPSPEERMALAQILETKLSSHENLDHERFGTIEGLVTEVRDDVKQLMKRRQSGVRRKGTK